MVPPAPAPAGAPAALMPGDGIAYRLKRKLLGPPLHSDELDHQRLGKPTALAVFASDNLSSSAYATEEILHALVPAVGLLAFSLVMPITGALLVMLALLILSYRETIKAYPSAGGAYLVTRDNFGIIPAQVAGAALLVGYILTVAVSVSAGTAALISQFEGLSPFRVPISLGFIAIVMYGNLRGVKESGRVFAVPTYFFMVNMGMLLAYGVVKYLGGDLHAITSYAERRDRGSGARGRARRTASSTAPPPTSWPRRSRRAARRSPGVEAISNGVPAFREPAWKHARQTLVVMGAGARRDVPRPVGAWPARSRCCPSRTARPPCSPRSARPSTAAAASARSSASRSRPPPCSSSCWPPTPGSPTSRAWPASRPATASSPVS